MKIAVNCFRLSPHYKGGINTFALGIIKGLSKQADVTVITSSDNTQIFEKVENVKILEIDDNKFKVIKKIFYKIPWLIKGFLPWRLLNSWIYRQENKAIDALDSISICPYVPTPLFASGHNKMIICPHDLQHLHYPHYFSLSERIHRKGIFSYWLKRANLVQVSSAFMKKDFLKNLNFLKENQMLLVPEGVDRSVFTTRDSANAIDKFRLPPEYLFYPAQQWPHKDHLTVVKALDLLSRKGLTIPLVLSGARYSAWPSIEKLQEELGFKSLFHVGLVSEEDLVFLYNHSKLVITASIYESSSLPILEAISCGKPVIAADTEPNKEFLKYFRLNFFKTQDPDDLAVQLSKIWTSKDTLEEQAKINLTQIGEFDWANVTKRFLGVLQ